MEWINVFGVVFIVIIMIPNIIYAIKCKTVLKISGITKLLKLQSKSEDSVALDLW